jgi:hypothetical protein
MKTAIIVAIQLLCLITTIMSANSFVNDLPIAIKVKEDSIVGEIKDCLKYLKAPQKDIQNLANAIFIASQSTQINYRLITALMYTESSFNKTAIGPENRTKIRYKGLMQTPTATWFSDVDTLHGARILKDKLKISNNNIKNALMFYKGGKNPTAHKQAEIVLKLYEELQRI